MRIDSAAILTLDVGYAKYVLRSSLYRETPGNENFGREPWFAFGRARPRLPL